MVITMNKCKEYQMMIPDFHKETLNYKDELMFLDHVADCEDCREEMEIYYIIEYGLNDSEEKNVNPKYRKYMNIFDFKGMVEQRIKDRVSYINWYGENEKIMNLVILINNTILFVVLIVLFIIKFC